MISLVKRLPRQLWVACSGGVDSMAVLDFLRRSHQVHVLHFNHGTAHAPQAEQFVKSYCADKHLTVTVGHVQHSKPYHDSWEEFWRNSRYEFFKSVPSTVVTAHHLDDCVETYLFNCLHGKHHTIPYCHANVVRPFLTTPKSEFVCWCSRKKVPWCEDESNEDMRYTRNLIRHTIVPQALQVNPGLRKVVRKLVFDSLDK